MNLQDYSYVDIKRLDSYIEQVESPVTYDKVPVYKVRGGLTGFGVEGEQTRHPRKLTLPEKIARLEKYLQKKKMLGAGRPIDSSFYAKDYVFCLETCLANKVIIPAAQKQSSHFDGMALWISDRVYDDPYTAYSGDEEGYPHRLFLLQDFPRSDEKTFYTHSAYSTLLALVDESKDLLERTKFKTVLEAGKHKEHEFCKQFSKDPFFVFTKLGARVGGNQIIKSLYRIRAVLYDEWAEEAESIVTFAYPIYVVFAGLPL